MPEYPEQQSLAHLLCHEGESFRAVHDQVKELRAKVSRLSVFAAIASEITYCAIHHAVHSDDCGCAMLGLVTFVAGTTAAVMAREDADSLIALERQEHDILEEVQAILVDPLAGDIGVRHKAAEAGLSYPLF